MATRSFSGQFTIRDLHTSGLSQTAARADTNASLIVLDPTLLAVSSERIKKNLWRELSATEPWRGRVFLTIRPARGIDDTILITSERFRDGWVYHVDLPDAIQRVRYVRTMVEVLLMEMANRGASERRAELPVWLIEGFTQQLLASDEIGIILPPPRKNSTGLYLVSTNVNARYRRPLARAREELRGHAPLTFDELSWPTDHQLVGDAGDSYRLNAQLFVNGLLTLKNGQACMRELLGNLSQHYNWQFAFLRAFHDSFQRPLDVEKWWTLHYVNFTQREETQTWSEAESWKKLERAVHPPVQVRSGTNEMPMHTEVPLQTVVREWDATHQNPALKGKLQELTFLRFRLPPTYGGLAEGYRRTLQTYLDSRDKKGWWVGFRKQANLNRAKEQALKELNALDAQREALRPKPEQVATVKGR